ncbi:glycosyltransferase family 39 protein [Apilactobacillus timberlakei]|uniref:Glycosyltransferase RgtA/B/C/D-like domain-containing protein n=3 Tax=Apilactobacillus timberlakei TaxID=2008380 RepID=A0ABY2YVJ8_9LACO|nr:glycosyltransferase family 39 protein [Apilactobacillus timberlakei]TPR15781.1 hypothetical protein DY052_04165 [Apilactobacillus timberlakei]TPR16142.1 hypothetical protein DY048_01380 [Apilactobacillus timberlakei]
MHPTFMDDEAFTMGMVHHNYKEILDLTALDIHPPLYYIVLKVFLTLTTFWTSNIFVEVFFARVLSIICSMIAFYYLCRLSEYFGFKHNKYLLWFAFLFMPFITGYGEQLTNIRMYAFSIMLMAIEIYYLIIYINCKPSKKYLFIFTLATILNFYTNYFSAVVAGTYLFLFFIDTVIKGKTHKAVVIFIAGIVSLISFIPCIYILSIQTSLIPSGVISMDSIKNSLVPFLKSLMFMVFIIPFIAYHKHLKNEFKLFYIYSMIVVFVNMLLVLESFHFRYLVPSYFVYAFFGINICLSFFKRYKDDNKMISIILLLPLFVIMISFGREIVKQIHVYDVSSIKLISNFNRWKKSDENNLKINLTAYSSSIQERGQNSIYLQSINKRISNKHYMNAYDYLGNGNDKLFRSIFWNVDHYYKKK